MKYKCKNCGSVYYEKISYCDCGNNVFIEINDDLDILYNENNNTYADYQYEENEYQNDCDECLYNDKFEKNKRKKYYENIAAVFFILSVIISCFLIYQGFTKPVKEKPVSEQNKVQKPTEEIPLYIDSFWDNTPKKQNNQKTAVNNSISQPEKSANITVKKEQKTKPVQIAKEKKLSESSNINTQPAAKKPDAKSQEQTAKELKAIIQKELEEKEKIKVQEQQQKEAFSKYKSDLRQALFNRFPIMLVQGSGTVEIGFSVSVNGILQNERIITPSPNKSLNDAVSHMLYQVQNFYAPPAGYKGEELKMKIEFNNGYYSFSYTE